MFSTADYDMNVLVSNVVSRNRYSHCRLCLKGIENQTQYLRFEDSITVNSTNNLIQPLYEILNSVLGENKIIEDIPGIDAVCMECVEKCFETFNFLHQCKNSSLILDRVFSNLLETLTSNVSDHKSLYISVNKPDSQCLLFSKVPEIQPRKSRDVRRKRRERDLYCQECNEIMDNITTLKVHNISHHGTVTCEICYKTFKSDLDLQEHLDSARNMKDHQNKSTSYFICKDCGKSFQTLDKLKAHEKKHESKNECPKCGKYYATKEFYTKHVKLCLEDKIDPHPLRSRIVKSHFCESCGKGYSTEGGLRVHKRFVHGNAKPHTCPHCGKQFTAPSYLKLHMVTHTGEKNFKCEICNNKFVSKEALLYHTRRHTGEKPYSCHMCDEKFVNASTRAEHVKFKHIGPTLKCEICSRKFVTATFLRQHMSRHHNPTSKLYTGRSQVPANNHTLYKVKIPVEENSRIIVKAKET